MDATPLRPATRPPLRRGSHRTDVSKSQAVHPVADPDAARPIERHPAGGRDPAATRRERPRLHRDQSGQTRCQIDSDSVGCEAPFTNPPIEDGEKANGVNITAAGEVQWVAGNLGDIPTVTIDYQTYDAAGWTIDATESGTRFTNQHTGHGMFVSIEKVDTF